MKSVKRQGPSGLTGVKSFSRLKILQVFMISPHEKWGFSSLQPMAPLCYHSSDGEKLTVTYIVVYLSRGYLRERQAQG